MAVRQRKRRSTTGEPEVEIPRVRTSERSSLKTCESQWYWGYVDRMKPVREAPALEFGTLVHKALEGYYKIGKRRGHRPASTFRKLYDAHFEEIYEAGYRDEAGEWVNNRDLGVAMLEGYYDLYHERDLQYEVISSERTFQVPVYDDAGVHVYTYVGTIDGVWLDRTSGRRQKVVLIDHKTAVAISTDYLSLDEQASAYWTWGVDAMQAEGVLKPGQEIEWIWFNFLRKALPDVREWRASENGMQRVYLNKDGTPSKVQPPPLYLRHKVYRNPRTKPMIRERAMNDFLRMKFLRENPERVSKSPAKFHCSFCAFKDLCILHEDGADWPSYVRGMMGPWDPYAAHEIEVAEKR